MAMQTSSGFFKSHLFSGSLFFAYSLCSDYDEVYMCVTRLWCMKLKACWDISTAIFSTDEINLIR